MVEVYCFTLSFASARSGFCYNYNPTLFSEDASEEVTNAAREFLSSCESEILNAITRTDDDEERTAIVALLRCKASPRKIAD